MSVTIIDEKLSAELAQASEPVQVRARDGHVLGVFTPVRRPPEPKISEEEMVRRLNDPNAKWYTAAEVEAKMREWRCSQ
jgi:hypothetical protein